MTLSLDTKYRPRTYADVLGQKSSVRVLTSLVKEGAGWKQSYLFAGPFGSGKTTLGRILARALLCESPKEGEPCDECVSCRGMLLGTSDAFVEVDAATNSGKADVKKIIEELDYSTFSGRRKLYLFDEAHQLSRDALDALLKPMEENQKGSDEKRLVCIFATTEPEKMRATVLSRCAPAFIIHHVPSSEIADRLAKVCEAEGFKYEYNALLLIADFTEGHIRDALKAIEGVASSNTRNVTEVAVRSYLHVDRNDLLCELLLAEGSQVLSISEEVLTHTPVGVAYERLLTATMLAISLGLKASVPPPYWNKALLERAWEKRGAGLLELADVLSSAPKRATEAVFKCDLLKWSKALPRVVQNSTQVVIETPPPKKEQQATAPTPPVSIPEMSLMEFSRRVKALRVK
jgi:DNA polymerase III subunit gamma/tau